MVWYHKGANLLCKTFGFRQNRHHLMTLNWRKPFSGLSDKPTCITQQICSQFNHRLRHAHALAAFQAFCSHLRSIFSTIRAENVKLMSSKNTFSISQSTVYPASSPLLISLIIPLGLLRNEPASVLTYVCYRLSMLGNYLCKQQPTSPSISMENPSIYFLPLLILCSGLQGGTGANPIYLVAWTSGQFITGTQ